MSHSNNRPLKILPTSPRVSNPDSPELELQALDTLWLQITGTLCNLTCAHCFTSCGPTNQQHGMLSVEQVRQAVAEAARQGVREYYFTGGEPFLHPAIRELITLTLQQGPLTILTNGTLIDEPMAAWLGETFLRAPYSLELHVSLDGMTPEENDPIRGEHTFEKAVAGIKRLVLHGLVPVITVTEVRPAMAQPASRAAFLEFLREIGLQKPRLQFSLPLLIGREAARTRGYREDEFLHAGDLQPGEAQKLPCHNCRMLTDDGIYPCPFLVNIPEARLGTTLAEGLVPIRLAWQPCYTCHTAGATCRA